MIFTTAELHQIMSYLGDRDNGLRPGWYFGNKEQFENRHKSIMEKVTAEIVRRSDRRSTEVAR